MKVKMMTSNFKITREKVIETLSVTLRSKVNILGRNVVKMRSVAIKGLKL